MHRGMMKVVRSTKSTLMPSIPRAYWMPSAGIQLASSVNW